MVTVILPGYSAHNKDWLEDTAESINSEGEIRAIYWDHWADPEKKFNPREKARILDDIVGVRITDIIAKSIGTLVSAYLIQKEPMKIRKAILNGICLNDLDENDKEVMKKAFKLISPENIICYQNEIDPHGSFEQAKKFFSDIDPKIQVISKNRNDHEYPYQDGYRKFLNSV